MGTNWEASTAAFVDKMVASMRFDSDDSDDEETPTALPSKLVRAEIAALPKDALSGPRDAATPATSGHHAPKHCEYSRGDGSSGVVGAPEGSAKELEAAPLAASVFTPDRDEAPRPAIASESRTRQAAEATTSTPRINIREMGVSAPSPAAGSNPRQGAPPIGALGDRITQLEAKILGLSELCSQNQAGASLEAPRIAALERAVPRLQAAAEEMGTVIKRLQGAVEQTLEQQQAAPGHIKDDPIRTLDARLGAAEASLSQMGHRQQQASEELRSSIKAELLESLDGMVRTAVEGKVELAEGRLEERAAAAGARASCGALHSVVRDAVAEEVARALLAAREQDKQRGAEEEEDGKKKEKEEEEEHAGGQKKEGQGGAQEDEQEAKANAPLAPTETKVDYSLSRFACSSAPSDVDGKKDASGRAAAPEQVQLEDRLFSRLSSLVHQLLPVSADNHNQDPEDCTASPAIPSKEAGQSSKATGSLAEDDEASVAVRLDFGSASPLYQLQPSAALKGTVHDRYCDNRGTQRDKESVCGAPDDTEGLLQRRQEEAEQQEEEWQLQQQQSEGEEDHGHDLQQSCHHPDVEVLSRRMSVSFSDDDTGSKCSMPSTPIDRHRRPIVAPHHRKGMRQLAGAPGGGSPGPGTPDSSLIRDVLTRQTGYVGRSSRRKTLSIKSQQSPLKALNGGLRGPSLDSWPPASGAAAAATGSGECEGRGAATGQHHEAREGMVVSLMDAASGAGLVLMLVGSLVLLGAALEANAVIDTGLLQAILTSP